MYTDEEEIEDRYLDDPYENIEEDSEDISDEDEENNEDDVEKRTIPDDFMPTDNLRVVFIHYVGQNLEGLNVYHFMVGENTEDVWGEGWSEKPAGNIPLEELMIPEDQFEYVKELRTDIKLDLAQNNSCYTMQDCRDKVIALASENLDDAEEYPEKGRIVVHFGDLLDDVEAMFARRNMFMRFV